MPENIDLTVMAGQIPAGMTFGVELEVVGVSRYTVQDHLTEVHGRVVGYGHDVPTGCYHILSDSSLHVDGCSREEHNCCYDSSAEVVSPVLQGIEGLRSLEKVTKGLSGAEALTNNSCGVHVHVGAADFHDDYNRMWRIMDRYIGLGLHQKAGRDGGQYAAPVMLDQIESYLKKFAYQQRTLYRFHRADIRRQAVNFCSLYKQDASARTIEFRQHAGTISFTALIVWIIAVTNLIDEVRNWNGCAKCNDTGHSGIVYCFDCEEFFCEKDSHGNYCKYCECSGCGHNEQMCHACDTPHCRKDNSNHNCYCYDCNQRYCGSVCPHKKVCEVCSYSFCTTHFRGKCNDCGQGVCNETLWNHGRRTGGGAVHCQNE